MSNGDNGKEIPEERPKEETTDTSPKEPVTVVEIRQEVTGNLTLHTKLIPPVLVYSMVVMLFSVVNNILRPKKNMVQLPQNGFRHNLGKFLGRK